MTFDGFLNFLTQAIFLLVAGITLLSWVKHRDQTRLDIALVFASLALAIIAQDSQDLLPAFAPLFSAIFFIALLTQSYFLLRVARYFRAVPNLVQQAAFIGLLVACASLVLTETAPVLVVILFIVYFTIIEGYASYLLIQGALTIPGITGKRLRLASIGSGLLALVFLIVFFILLIAVLAQITELPEGMDAILTPLIQILALLSGLSYYFGFAPPRWLRQYWQLSELPHFMRLSGERKTSDRNAVFDELSLAALRTVGGEAAVIAHCDADGQNLNIEIDGAPSLQIKNLEAGSGPISEAWRSHQADVIRLPAEIPQGLNRWAEQLEAKALFIVPIISPMRAWGLLVVALRYAPLFTQDDLGMLVLLAERSVIPLDYSVLVEDALHASEERYDHLLDNMLEGAQIIGFDWRYMYVNTASTKPGHEIKEKLLGHTMMEVYPGIENTELFSVLQRCMNERVSHHLENEFTYPDGSHGWFELSIQPVEAGIFILSVDITERNRAREILRESEQRFRALIENSRDAIALYGADGTILYGSPSTTQILGYKLDEFTGRNAFELIHPEDQPHVTERLTMSMQQPRTHVSVNARVLHKNGEWRWLEGIFTNLLDEPGVQAVVNNYRDITESGQAEEKIAYQANLLENVNDAVIGSDANSLVRFWNHGAERMFGWKAEEAIGQSAREILRSEMLNIDRETALKILAETGRWKGEAAQYRKDGSRVISEVSSITLKDANGRISGYVSVSRDISERKQAEEELQKAYDGLELQVQERTAALSQANALLQTMMDNMPDHIYFKDVSSRFIKNSRSQARMMGVNDAAEVVGKTDFDFFPQAHAQRAYDEEQRLIKSGDSLVDIEERVVWPDGRVTWVSTTKLPLRDINDGVIGTFGISRDITERKQAEEELQRSNMQLDAANKELEAFSYSVSHDLRAPLRTIDGFSQAVMEDYGEVLPEQGRSDLARVRKAAQYMAQLIDDLLNLSRVTRAPMKSDTVNLSKLAQGIIAELQRTHSGRRVKFTSVPNLNVRGDPHLLQVVLENLLNNAWKFSSKRERAEIELGSKRENKETIFFIRDNGAGFDMAYTGKLFGAFQRLHAMTDFPGTGVGLATVQRIIHRHGGRIWAEAELDHGATFFFTVPVLESAKSKDASKDKGSIIERAKEII